MLYAPGAEENWDTRPPASSGLPAIIICSTSEELICRARLVRAGVTVS